MHLPNGGRRPWPQPEDGDTKLIALDGVAPVVRSTEQQAADNAAGREWRNVALLSGIDNNLYGRALGRNAWIWQDAAGDRWKVSIGSLDLSAFDKGLDTHVRLARFGVFGAPHEEREVALTLSDIGQSEPIVSTRAPFEEPRPIAGGAMRILDVTTTGDRAIAEIYVSAPTGSKPDICEFGPSIGYLEISLAGAVRSSGAVASASVLRTRQQTLGAYDANETRTFVRKGAKFETTEMVSGHCPEDGEVVTVVSGAGISFLPGWGEREYEEGNDDSFYSVSGRIIAMWYHNDVAVDVEYNMTGQSTSSTSLFGDYSGSVTYVLNCATGMQTSSGEMTSSITQSWSRGSSLFVSLSVGGVVVDSLVWTEDVSGERRRIGGRGSPSYTGSASVSGSFQGASYTVVFTPSLSAPTLAQPWAAEAQAWASFGNSLAQGLLYQQHLVAGKAGPEGARVDSMFVSPYMYSNHTVGIILACRRLGGDYLNVWRGISTPAGSDGGSMATVGSKSAILDGSMRRHASWNPVTLELVRDSSIPVCWA